MPKANATNTTGQTREAAEPCAAQNTENVKTAKRFPFPPEPADENSSRSPVDGQVAGLGSPLLSDEAGPRYPGDRFGIPDKIPDESKAERIERAARLHILMEEVLEAATYHFGKPAARKFFAIFARGKAGRPAGRANPGRDNLLLRLYDGYAGHPDWKYRRGSIPREIALRLCEKEGTRTPTVDAIAKQVRLLVNQRKRDAEANERNALIRVLLTRSTNPLGPEYFGKK